MKKHAPKHNVSRRFGLDIYGTGGESLQRRISTRPGHASGTRHRRLSEYGRQLLEKQKARAIYGVAERQFRCYVEDAARQGGNPAENLLRPLERRLDNVVYRLGFARTRPMARQLVSHGHVRVNDRKVNIPSYLVRPGEAIGLTEAAAQIPIVAEEREAGRPVPAWLKRQETSGHVLRLPDRAEMEQHINEDQIVAYYSR